jgi:hypothetical protein
LVVLLLAISAASALQRAPANGMGLLDLDGRTAAPFRNPQAKFFAFIFVRTDCPISNSYAPEIRKLHQEFAPQGVTFWLVYVDADETPVAIRQHLRDFNFPCGALRDPRHLFVKRSQVRVTPEVAIYRPGGALIYHGRIDDRNVDFGKRRPAPTQRDFADALIHALAGKQVAPASGPAVGCYIEDAG